MASMLRILPGCKAENEQDYIAMARAYNIADAEIESTGLHNSHVNQYAK